MSETDCDGGTLELRELGEGDVLVVAVEGELTAGSIERLREVIGRAGEAAPGPIAVVLETGSASGRIRVSRAVRADLEEPVLLLNGTEAGIDPRRKRAVDLLLRLRGVDDPGTGPRPVERTLAVADLLMRVLVRYDEAVAELESHLGFADDHLREAGSGSEELDPTPFPRR